MYQAAASAGNPDSGADARGPCNGGPCGVMLAALTGLAPFWKSRKIGAHVRPGLPVDDLHALGWLSPAQFGPVARDVTVRDILDPLATIGITISAEGRAELLA